MKRFYLAFLPVFLYCSLFIPSSSYSATKKALLVGINNYKNLPFFSRELGRPITNLKGSINDAYLVKNVLISRFGFRNEDILVLKDSEATREDILRNFEDWLIMGTKRGDLVVFYFSGHGTQVPESFPGNEPDKLDEAICPYDVVPEGAGSVNEAKLIIDDEIGILLKKLQGRDVVFIADCCHSGTNTRGIRGVPVSRLELTPGYQPRLMPVKIKGLEVTGKSFFGGVLKKNYISEEIPEGQIYLYSSRPNQISVEVALNGGFYGAFTKVLVDGLGQRREITYRELYEYVKKKIKDGYHLELDQDPQLEPERGKILDRKVFSLRSDKEEPEQSQPDKEKPKPPEPPKKPQPIQQVVIKPPEPPPTPAVTPSAPSLPALIPQPPKEVRGEKILVRIERFQGGSPSVMKALESRLRGLPYVEIVEGELFDRLIRGEVKGGEYFARVLNRIGDAVTIPPVKSIDDLIRGMGPHLEYVYMVKQLARISHPNPPFKVKVWPTDEERRDFRIGEKIVFNFSSEKDCHLLMLNLDSHGNFHIIFPNQFYKDNRIKGGEKREIPDEKMGQEFEFEFGEPAGEEVVKVIATLEPLRLKDLGLEKFEQLFDAKGRIAVPEKMRQILVKKVGENISSRKFVWSEDTIVIRSHKGGIQ